ncbi:MAG: hypothetical protein NTX73_13070 [Rhodobacterales bacterium]|nr:hypothetical protein [Rhodobacterales bacterium]
MKVLLALILVLMTNASHALEFTFVSWHGQMVLRADGEIVQGDAARIGLLLPETPLMPHGLPVLLLYSGGGDVIEALLISEILDNFPTHTVVPSDAKCASACASIVFIAGALRTVEEGGYLGQHSCSVNGLPNQECNDVLSRNALEHGVSYGSIAAFVTYVPPSEVAWFSRTDADCWGLTRYAFELESGFTKFEPCVVDLLTGRFPPAQSAWRVDFFKDGYRAFLRPAADHLRELELGLYCDELKPGKLFLSLDVGGSAQAIQQEIVNVSLDSNPIRYDSASFSVLQYDAVYSRVVLAINTEDVLPFLTRANELNLQISLRPPFQDMFTQTFLSNSRSALIFAANNCINRMD